MRTAQVKKFAKRLKRWSYSTWVSWNRCPRQLAYRKLAKLPEEKSYAQERGIKIHSLAEHFVSGGIRGLPDELRKFDQEIHNLRALEPETEAKLRVDENWIPVDNWNDAWAAAILDVVDWQDDTITIVDYKTGRVRSHRVQAEVYVAHAAAWALDTVEHFDVEFFYLDKDQVSSFEFSADEALALQDKWSRLVRPMMEDDQFLPTPGRHCKWCPYRSDRKMPDGRRGPCRDWKRA